MKQTLCGRILLLFFKRIRKSIHKCETKFLLPKYYPIAIAYKCVTLKKSLLDINDNIMLVHFKVIYIYIYIYIW